MYNVLITNINKLFILRINFKNVTLIIHQINVELFLLFFLLKIPRYGKSSTSTLVY